MPGLSGYAATKAWRMKRDREKRMAQHVRGHLVAILRRGSIVDTDHQEEIDAAMVEQERIAKRIEKTIT